MTTLQATYQNVKPNKKTTLRCPTCRWVEYPRNETFTGILRICGVSYELREIRSPENLASGQPEPDMGIELERLDDGTTYLLNWNGSYSGPALFCTCPTAQRSNPECHHVRAIQAAYRRLKSIEERLAKVEIDAICVDEPCPF